MKRDPAARAMKIFVQCAGSWLVVAAFAGMVHATASANGGQLDRKGQHKAMQPQSLDSCDPCAACQLAPGFESNMTSSSDHPEQVAYASMWTPDERYEFPRDMPANAIRPGIALRIRYCRWLN